MIKLLSRRIASQMADETALLPPSCNVQQLKLRAQYRRSFDGAHSQAQLIRRHDDICQHCSPAHERARFSG
jgi:hypothetical protein